MKSLEKRFRNLEQLRPNCGSIINFNGAVKGMRFSRARIGRWFVKLVDKGDYKKCEAREILDYAFRLSWPEAYAKTPKFRVRGPAKPSLKV